MYKIVNRRKLVATAAADLAGRLLYGPARLLRGREPVCPEAVREILLIRTAYIGDVIMTVPMLKPLRQRFPQARITFLTAARARPVLEGNPHVDEILTYDPFWFYPTSFAAYRAFVGRLRRRSFDLVIEARADIRELLLLVRPLAARYKVSYDVGGGGWLLTHVVPYPGLKHKVEYHLDIARYLGCPEGPLEWGLYLSDRERDEAGALLAAAGVSGPFVAVHPGSRQPLKMWFPERYAALCDAVAAGPGLPVVLVGSADERPLVERIAAAATRPTVNLAGALTLRQLAAVFARAAVLVCNDSSPMHVAAATKTPTVAIFGPSKSRETAPYATLSRVVERDYPCRSACDEGTCRNTARPQGCLRDVGVADVLGAVEGILAESRGERVQV